MNKSKFRLLVFFMSLSLIGIILVQLYWVNSSLKNNEDQFRYHIYRILGKVSSKLQDQEAREFYEDYNSCRDSTGHDPVKSDLLDYYRKKLQRGHSAVYGLNAPASRKSKKFIEKENTDKNLPSVNKTGKVIVTDTTAYKVDTYDKYSFEKLMGEYVESKTIEERVTRKRLRKMLTEELAQSDITTPFEFAVYNNGQVTGIKSDNFKWDPGTTFQVPFLLDDEGHSHYRLLVRFPEKTGYIFSSIVGITSLSMVFTLIIIIAYLSAISQLVKQKQISEIKTDFINNMTHEFKTPIATINLALDAIKNPKIFEDREKVQRYLQMIRDENKRMHGQVENVLQISKLDKKELDIIKDQADIHDVIEDAIEHVHLIIEARHGTLTRHFHAERTTALLNDVHFTNVLVNILDNAIKYSPDEPVIDIYTENVKDFILIKIRDRGLGMTKVTQKRIFEKFYREHTGDIHNVKGHGLGLAYVKRIIDDHNCHIYVESEKGKGSTFIIKMPLIN